MSNKVVKDFTAKAVNDPDPIGTALKTISEKHPEVLELQKEFEEIEDREFLQKEGNTTLIITGNGIIKSFKVDLSQIQFPVKFDNSIDPPM
jgi:deoxyhypusine synthase